VAAALMQTKPERIAYVGGVFRSEETAAQLSLGELVSAAAKARLLEDGITPCLAVERCHDPGKLTHPSGCHVCELEIDPDSGEVDLLRYTSIDDVGRVQNPALARAQVHGAVAQGFGQAVLEACHYDAETGQLLSGSLLDYALPRADNLPFFEPGFGQEDDGAPLRGLGEMGTIAATPAIVNALIDALAQIGVGDIDIPATPERVWRACRPATATTTAAGR
jgi:carbon-monoxide dehydrogenase large subunit